MKLLLFLLKQSRWIVVGSILAGVVSGAANTLLIALVHDLLTDHSLGQRALVLSFLALCLGLPLTRLISEVLMAYLAQKAIFDLRVHMCERILAVPLRELEELGTPRLLASLTDDIGAIANTMVQIPMVVIQITVVLGCLVYLGWLSLPLVTMVVVFIAVGAVSWQFVARRATGLLRSARQQQDVLFSHFRAVTEGVKELKLHQPRRRAFMSELLHTTAHQYRRFNVLARAFFSAGGAFLQLLYFGAFGLLLVLAPTQANIEPSVLTGFTLVILYLLTPLDYLIGIASDIGRTGVALSQVERLGLSLDSHAVEGSGPQSPASPWKRLELVGVTHTYHREKENSRFVLGPLNAAFDAGEVVFITGGNGSGKTTLGKLITGLYLPEEGHLQLDGRPVTSENLEQYRGLFSVVFSDFFLFDRMLGLNSPEADGRTREYLERLQLTNKVQVQDGRLSTTALSQGQRKRLALLTAYMEDRPVYLFDEWAADQDPEFKAVFYHRLLPELKARGKTVFVITHDDAYFHLADHILKLEDGRVGTAHPYEQESVPLASPAS